VDHDLREEPDDLLALLVGQPGVEARADLGQGVMDLLGDHIAHWGL
jgi:hypothetical protein